MDNLNLPKDDGFKVKAGDFNEALLTFVISSQMMMGEVLRRQIRLERLMNDQSTDDEDVQKELNDIAKTVEDAAYKQKSDIIAKLYFKNGGSV